MSTTFTHAYNKFILSMHVFECVFLIVFDFLIKFYFNNINMKNLLRKNNNDNNNK